MIEQLFIIHALNKFFVETRNRVSRYFFTPSFHSHEADLWEWLSQTGACLLRPPHSTGVFDSGWQSKSPLHSSRHHSGEVCIYNVPLNYCDSDTYVWFVIFFNFFCVRAPICCLSNKATAYIQYMYCLWCSLQCTYLLYSVLHCT